LSKAYDILEPVFRILPEIQKPARKPSLRERLFWTALVLVAYFLLGQIPLYGIPRQTQEGLGALVFLQVVLASKRGTLMELGIGPIVTAGIVWELLVGSRIVQIDLTTSEGRKLFAGVQKIFAIMFAAFEALAYIVGGVYGNLTITQQILVFSQLFIVSIFVLLMDELLQKGWGIGSAISLFIAAGVAQQIFWEMFSPIGPLPDGLLYGFFPSLFYSISYLMTTGNSTLLQYTLVRPSGYPDLIGFLAMLLFLTLLTFLESTKITIPVASARFGGMRTRIPLKLMYVSNIPVILVGALYADVMMLTQALWPRFNPNNSNPILNVIAMYNVTENGLVPLPGSLVYYMTPPRTVWSVARDPVHVIIYAAIFIILSILFAVAWVMTSGMDPESQAEQLVKAQLQIPGFRKSEKVIAAVLKRYVWALTVFSGILIGVIAVISDILGAMGGGIGILLMVGILVQYYQLLASERALEMYPALARLIGK